jgi:hypothetical protein
MARAKTQGNGHVDRFEIALTNMLQGQALLQQQLSALATRQADTDSRIAETERRIDERFNSIETILLEQGRILPTRPQPNPGGSRPHSSFPG